MLIAKRSLKYANLLPRIEFALLLMREKHERTKTLSHLENPVKNLKSLIYNLYFICTEFVRGPNIHVCVVYGKPRIFLTPIFQAVTHELKPFECNPHVGDP